MSPLVADRRVHPGTILLRFLREAPQTLLAVPAGIAILSEGGLGGALLVAAGIGAIGLFFQWLHWSRFRYAVGAHEIVIESGILHRNRREIPFDRIQDVDIERALLARIFGLAKVRIETGAGGKDEGVLDSVTAAEAAQLRAAVRAWQSAEEGSASPAADAAAPAAKERGVAVFAMSPPRVLLFGLFSFSLVYLGGLFAVIQTLDDPLKTLFGIDIYDVSRWTGIAGDAAHGDLSAGTIGAALVAAVLLGTVASVLRILARDFGFRLTSEGDRFRRERGLLTRTEVIIAKRRIQLAYVETSPIRRLFGWFSLSFQTLGAATDGSGHQVAAPFARAEELPPVLRECERLRLPGDEALAMVSQRHIVRAMIRNILVPAAAIAVAAWSWRPAILFAVLLPGFAAAAAFARRFHRYGVAGDLLFVRRGVWRQQLYVVPLEKAQAVTIARSWLQRRLGLATLDVDTAGATLTRAPRIVDLRHDIARRIAAEIAARGAGPDREFVD